MSVIRVKDLFLESRWSLSVRDGSRSPGVSVSGTVLVVGTPTFCVCPIQKVGSGVSIMNRLDPNLGSDGPRPRPEDWDPVATRNSSSDFIVSQRLYISLTKRETGPFVRRSELDG